MSCHVRCHTLRLGLDIFHDDSLLHKNSVNKDCFYVLFMWCTCLTLCQNEYQTLVILEEEFNFERSTSADNWSSLLLCVVSLIFFLNDFYSSISQLIFDWKNQLLPTGADWRRVIRRVIMKYSPMESCWQVQFGLALLLVPQTLSYFIFVFCLFVQQLIQSFLKILRFWFDLNQFLILMNVSLNHL